jgi:predicted nucleotidyltransferase
MNNPKWSIVSLAISLALAGFAMVFSESLPFATILITIAFILVIGTGVWSAYEFIPKMFTDPNGPKAKARMIYKLAADRGGTIHATHIFPTNRNPDEDLAIEHLAKSRHNVELSFHRILLLDSIEDERFWMERLFASLPSNVAKRFYLLSSYPLLLPRITKALIPRLNLLLYQSPNGRRCDCLVGLDRLHIAGVNVNFALHSRSKRVYHALLRYIEQITASRHFKVCSSLEEYNANQRISSQVEQGQAVVSRIVDFAENTPGIVFVGMFGSIAREALGFASELFQAETDADVDLLIVFNPRTFLGSEDELRRAIENALDPAQTHVTWGPDLSKFYEFRDEEKIYVDIECHKIGSDFYKKNRLLGYSVFRYFMPLYSIDQRPIASYFAVPKRPLTTEERWNLVVGDRQGLASFQKRLGDSPKSTDPRRLCTHILRNTVWAITGAWPTTGRIAGEHLGRLVDWSESEEIKAGIELLGLTKEEIRRDLSSYYDQVKALTQCVLNRAKATMER